MLWGLPSVKVALPAAMDYKGAYSQAEYNIALEGRFKAQTCREETSETLDPIGTSRYNLATPSQVLKNGTEKMVLKNLHKNGNEHQTDKD